MRRRTGAISTVLSLVAVAGCAGPRPPPPEVPATASSVQMTAQREAELLLEFYNPVMVALMTEANRAAWLASTDVTAEHTGMRTGADTALSAFTGSLEMIRRARSLLECSEELEPVTVRELRSLLALAASAPQTDPDLARRRIAAESAQSARLDGFPFCLAREEGECIEPVSTNDIDRILVTSDDLDERWRAWEASKEVGAVLRDGLIDLQELRNGVAQEMGYDDFFAFQVSNYDMTTAEMMVLLDELIEQIRPLYVQLHCWVRYELARRYGVDEPPELIPAHWLGNRWAQSWPGLVEGVEMDTLLEGREPQWLVEQAERFYVGMGFERLPESFYELSDLYPVTDGERRHKNAHASAWHIDLNTDVRSLMSVEPDWRWFTTTHHELGHIYYYLAYSRPEVPPLLRSGANRSFHEGLGELIALAVSQEPYLRQVEMLGEDQEIDELQWLLDSALTGPIVFLPWAAGVMSHFEMELYAEDLPPEQLNRRWWEMVARYQGVAPPSPRGVGGCDACTKTHINDDPAQYYDYALATVLAFQLHQHICREILGVDPHGCSYHGHREVGDFLSSIMAPGATRDWRELLDETLGAELSAAPMLEYYAPLMDFLEEQNQGRQCTWTPS